MTDRLVKDIMEDKIIISPVKGGGDNVLTAELILSATGRIANLDRLDLDRAGIEHFAKGIITDERLRTNQPHIAAIGDVLGGVH